jgi:predicted KAP-like P-loop ATPase
MTPPAPLKIRFLPDQPITEKDADLLGFGDFIDVIYDSIRYTETPFVYGVLGDWGSGKTSIMRLLQNRFKADFQVEGFLPIWFDAWKYENESNMLYPLLNAVYESYKEHVSKGKTVASSFAKRFNRVVTTSALMASDAVLRVGTKALVGESLTLGDVQDHLKQVNEHEQQDKIQKIFGTWTDQIERMKKDFEDLLTEYGKKVVPPDISHDQVRFVIFIDDLDRCLPETTISILENIKNHLSVRNIVFVLGLNPQVVYQGIRHKYAGLEINGQEYLEKILNYTFYVPEPIISNMGNFVETSFLRLLVDKTQYEDYRKHLEAFRDVLLASHFSNPRKIKRILNRYLLFIRKHSSPELDYQLQVNNLPMRDIAKLLVVAEYFPHLFQIFLTNPGEIKSFGFGAQNFDIDDFEKKHGVVLRDEFPTLKRIHTLFDIHKETSNIRELAEAVYAFTRLN